MCSCIPSCSSQSAICCIAAPRKTFRWLQHRQDGVFFLAAEDCSQSRAGTHVRLASLADIEAPLYPRKRTLVSVSQCPLCAKSGRRLAIRPVRQRVIGLNEELPIQARTK